MLIPRCCCHLLGCTSAAAGFLGCRSTQLMKWWLSREVYSLIEVVVQRLRALSPRECWPVKRLRHCFDLCLQFPLQRRRQLLLQRLATAPGQSRKSSALDQGLCGLVVCLVLKDATEGRYSLPSPVRMRHTDQSVSPTPSEGRGPIASEGRGPIASVDRRPIAFACRSMISVLVVLEVYCKLPLIAADFLLLQDRCGQQVAPLWLC